MTNQFDSLLLATQLTGRKPISRAQLPLLLAKVNGSRFAQILFDWFGFVLDEEQKQWFSLDGKELRGSIQPGHSRGEVVVSAMAHQNRQVVGQQFYRGDKESERPAVSQLLNEQGLWGQKLSLDALHLIPTTLQSVHAAAGVYVVGLKGNQDHLYRHCICQSLFQRVDYERVDEPRRHHGRLEQRTYRCVQVGVPALAPRWRKAGLTTLVWVVRSREKLGVVSEQVSYFVSNQQPGRQQDADELFDAIRQHWTIEVMHHKRDVTLSEDDLRTGQASISRLMGSLRTLVVNLLEKANTRNMAAQMDSFADKFHTLIQFLTQQMVL